MRSSSYSSINADFLSDLICQFISSFIFDWLTCTPFSFMIVIRMRAIRHLLYRPALAFCGSQVAYHTFSRVVASSGQFPQLSRSNPLTALHNTTPIALHSILLLYVLTISWLAGAKITLHIILTENVQTCLFRVNHFPLPLRRQMVRTFRFRGHSFPSHLMFSFLIWSVFIRESVADKAARNEWVLVLCRHWVFHCQITI